MAHLFYNDYLYKKPKPKSDVLERLLEFNEQQLVKTNEIHNLYNVSVPTQDDIWISGRIFSENAGSGGGKLTEHNVAIQGSYVCSNSHSIPLNLSHCNEYSLFPGQIVMINGRNPDGKRFFCKEIVEPNYVQENKQIKKEIKTESTNIDMFVSEDGSIETRLEPNENMDCLVASGPYMITASADLNSLNQLLDVAKSNNPHILILLGPFLDLNHDLIGSGNIQTTFEELLQSIFDQIASKLGNTRTQVIIQPSVNDVTQEQIYPVNPFVPTAHFQKTYKNFHFLQEPNMIKINGIQFAITSTDVIKDLTSMAVSKTQSSDKLARNFVHMLRQKSFYPIYPPPDHVCIDYEAWNKHAKIYTHPKIFIAVSDMAKFTKEVNNCVCINPGRFVRGTATGSYAQITIQMNKIQENDQDKNSGIEIMQAIRKIQTNVLNFVSKGFNFQATRSTSNSQPSEFISTNLENGLGRYVCQLQRVTFKFCKENPGSRGIREFVENGLVDFAKQNPGVVVYLQPKRHRRPKISAEYLNGSKQNLDVHQYSREKLTKWLEFMRTRKGDTIVRILKKQKTHNPSIQGAWNPFTNKIPSRAVENFPSAELNKPASIEKTATEKILELAKNPK
ncbi:DNA polymerase alpha subunit B [Brachionus plicatilis]|uniref:DNA polymerase alpha subunit B n=1 Tax=Brachionus plicatilis TaxID=10195 RepID=A0A3M7RHC3_BRAPC|nr:DNA polymerase alpha subunit B [Brachionus plicatilis]